MYVLNSRLPQVAPVLACHLAVDLENFRLSQSLSTTKVWQYDHVWAVVESFHLTWQHPVAAGITPGEEWWHWFAKCGNAENFSFLGISCVDARTPASRFTTFSQNNRHATKVAVEASWCDRSSSITPALVQRPESLGCINCDSSNEQHHRSRSHRHRPRQT